MLWYAVGFGLVIAGTVLIRLRSIELELRPVRGEVEQLRALLKG